MEKIRKTIKALFLLLLIGSLYPITLSAMTVAEAEKVAWHASIILTGENENGNTAFLMALHYENGKPKAWGIPGGRVKDKLPRRTPREAAADELYEETAAFPEFAPSKMLPKLLVLPDDKVYIDESVPGKIGIYYFLDYEHLSGLPARIKEGSKERVNNRSVVDFREMRDWTLVTWDQLYEAIDQGVINIIPRLPITTRVNKFDFTVLRKIETLNHQSVDSNVKGTEVDDKISNLNNQPHRRDPRPIETSFH